MDGSSGMKGESPILTNPVDSPIPDLWTPNTGFSGIYISYKDFHLWEIIYKLHC
jgi:hypothetical protein